MRPRFKRAAIFILLIFIVLLVIFVPGLPWSSRTRHSLKRAIIKSEIRLAQWRGESPRLASIAGRVHSPGVQIEALDSRSGFAALTDKDGNFVLPGVMWYPKATYELVIADSDTAGRLIEITAPRQLADTEQFDVGELDIGHAVPVALQSLIGLNSITLEDFDSSNSDYYKDLFGRLTEGKGSDEEKLQAINDYVASKLNYEETQRELESPRRVLERGSQYCGFLSVAMRTLLAIGGYRARQVDMIDGQNPPVSHAVVEVFYSGRWHLYDPTYGLIFRNSDGEVASYHDVRLNPGLISESLLARFPENVQQQLKILLPAVYGTGYHHFFYFRGEQWSASKAQHSS